MDTKSFYPFEAHCEVDWKLVNKCLFCHSLVPSGYCVLLLRRNAMSRDVNTDHRIGSYKQTP
jgi:hypothetical protein